MAEPRAKTALRHLQDVRDEGLRAFAVAKYVFQFKGYEAAKPCCVKGEAKGREGKGEEEKENSSVSVTRELQIKSSSNGGGNMEMDREVVLRRIHQRKRVNKFRSALQALVSCSPFSKTSSESSLAEY